MNEELGKLGTLHTAAQFAEKLSESLSELVCAVWQYQEAHKPPKCCDLDAKIHNAWLLVEQYDEESDDVRAMFHRTGLEIIRLRKEAAQEYWRKQEAERIAKQAKKAKPKTQKKTKAA